MILKCKEDFGDMLCQNIEYDVIKMSCNDFVFYKVRHDNGGEYWTTKERIEELFYSIRDIRKLKLEKIKNKLWSFFVTTRDI